VTQSAYQRFSSHDGTVIVLRLRRTMPVVLAVAVGALAAGCSWIQPSNQVLADQGQSTRPIRRNPFLTGGLGGWRSARLGASTRRRRHGNGSGASRTRR
jgi:hypothetical protein